MKNRRKQTKQKAKRGRPRVRRTRHRKQIKIPKTVRQYFSQSPQSQQMWDSVVHVISKMRASRQTLSKAAKEFGIEPNLVIRLAGATLRKQSNGRYLVKKHDTLLRVVSALTTKGKLELAFKDSRQARLVGVHWAAVQRHLQRGDDSALLKFKGRKVIDASGKRHLLLTNLDELDRQASAGILSFESMYAGGAQ